VTRWTGASNDAAVPDALREACRTTPILDTHEHMLPVDRLATGEVGPEDLIGRSYVAWALRTLPEGGWEAFRQALAPVRTRAFYRHWLRAMQSLYGFEGDLDERKWAAVREQAAANHARGDWHRHVLRDRANVARAILDQYWDHLGTAYDRELFSPCLRVNPLAMGFHSKSRDHNGASAHELAEQEGVRPRDFDEYEGFCRNLVAGCKSRGIVCLKSALAYDRSLDFGKARRDDAARVWGVHPRDVTAAERKAFGDYIVDLLAAAAGEAGLPFQWHTGLGRLAGSHPHGLIGLIERHPDTTFVLLHGGYPWCREWLAMAFTYANVRLDLTWLPHISPTAAARTLEEAVDVANADVVCGGGGDAWTPEESFAALQALRDTVEEGLTSLVSRGRLGLADACDVAGRILFGNAAELYGMAGQGTRGATGRPE